MNPFFSSTVKIFLTEVAVYLAVTFGLHFSLFSSTLRGFFSLPAEVDSFILVPALYSGLVAMLVAVLVSLYMRSRIRQQVAAMEQDTLDNVLSPVIILDDMNRYAMINRAAELTLSLNRNQSIGTSASQEISSLANGSTAKFGKDLFKVMRCQASFGGLDQSSVMITLTDISRDVMLKETMASITRAMGDLESNSLKITDSSTMLSQGATQQASSLASITTFLGEINKKGQGSSTAATKGTQLAIQAREAAEHSSAEIVNTLKAMADVQEAGVRIARIVKIIDDVAFQTNLLALNAAVEAARAGRHGKGFAVVADEVRNLAGRSAKAAKDTASMVEDITTRLGNAGSYIHKLEEMVRNIVQDAIRMSDATASASSASAEQASGIQQVNRELIQMDTVTHSTMLAAEQTAAAVGVFSRQTTDVKKMLEEITAAFHIASENQSGAPSSQRSRRPEYSDPGRAEVPDFSSNNQDNLSISLEPLEKPSWSDSGESHHSMFSGGFSAKQWNQFHHDPDKANSTAPGVNPNSIIPLEDIDSKNINRAADNDANSLAPGTSFERESLPENPDAVVAPSKKIILDDADFGRY